MAPASGATYAQAEAYGAAGAEGWSRAWGASEIGAIRKSLGEMKAAYQDCLKAADAANGTGNAAELARLRSTATAYIAVADGALAMYDGADAYEKGRSQMDAGNWLAAADSFGSAASLFAGSRSLLGNATDGLGRLAGSGPAALVPLVKGKAAYMGEFEAYAEGWQHAAFAYWARANGNGNVSTYEAAEASQRFAGLRSPSAFAADATANFRILGAMMPMSADLVLENLRPYASLVFKVTSVSPDWTHTGAQGQVLDVYGGGFEPGAQVQLSKGAYNGESTRIDAAGEIVSLTHIRCNVDVPDCSAYRGEYNVFVQNPGGQVRSLPWGVRVGDFDEPITIEPRWADAGETVALRLHDEDGLLGGAQVRIVNLNGQEIEATGETGTDTSLACTLAIPPDAETDTVSQYTTYYLYTRNEGDATWRSTNVPFLVLDGPTVTGVNWYQQHRGTTAENSVAGLNFEQGAQVRLRGPGNTYIDAAGEQTLGGGRISMDLVIPPSAEIGWYDVEVQNPGMTTWNRMNDAFLVNPNPQIAGVSPSSAKAGETVYVVITGLDFVSTAGFQVGLSTYPEIRASSVIGLSPGQIACTLAIPPGTQPRSYALFVHINTDMDTGIGGATTFAYHAFQVT